jgi:hypothetical protein
MLPLRDWLMKANLVQEALESIRRSDESMLASLNEVSIPAGLQERTIERLTVECTDLSFDERSEVGEHASPAEHALVQPAQRTSDSSWTAPRRPLKSTWVAAAIALATVSAAVAAILTWGPLPFAPTNDVSSRDLCVASIAWVQQAEQDSWPVLHHGPNARLQPIASKLIGRKEIQTDYGPTECYMTSLPNGSRIYQFVIRVNRPWGLPSKLPMRPEFPIQGYACSAYQQGDQVFVLAVEGDAASYRQAIENGLPVT